MEEKSDLAFAVLESLQKVGILSDLILIGSWCHLFYKHYFNDAPEIPLVRTLDMDFLIPRQRRTHKEVDVPQLLSQMGFETVVSYPSGYKKFIHPDLTVEFLIPELGRGADGVYEIKHLNINAQPLRFLNILQDYVTEINFKGISVKVPEPAAYALHKFIIARRRVKREKAQKDLLAAKEIAEFLIQNDDQKKKLRNIYLSFPKKWQDKIKTSTKEVSPVLFQLLTSL